MSLPDPDLPMLGQPKQRGFVKVSGNPARPTITTSVEPPDERPWFRTAAWLYAHGNSREEMASACGVPVQSITIALQLPKFRELVANFVADTGSKIGLQRQISRSALQAFMDIEYLARHAQSETVRLKANQDILDRAIGKAPQITKRDDDAPLGDPLEEAILLDKFIADGTKLLQKEGVIQPQSKPRTPAPYES